MKQFYFVILCFILTGVHAQEISNLDYSTLDLSDLKTNIFIKETSPLSNLGKNSNHYNMFSYIQSYKELSQNSLDEEFKNTTLPKGQITSYSQVIPIGILHVSYENLSKEHLNLNKIRIEDKKVYRNTNDYFFNFNTSTIIAPLSLNKRGLNTSFKIPSNFVYNNTKNTITNIKVNFDDGNGYISATFDEELHVNYSTPGTKELAFILELSNGEVIERFSKITIQYSNEDTQALFNRAPSDIISSTIADLSAYSGSENFAGLGEYEVFLSPDNVLDKPIFLVDGFDPGDTRDITAVYNMLGFDLGGTPQNLGDTMRNEEDFDIVIINFPQYFKMSDGSLLSMKNATDVNNDGVIDVNDYPGSTLIDGGVDFIERNAMIVVDVLNLINASKTGTEENVVIGPSMGGLITRYALNYMENQTIDHDTRLWISFDSPHLGANVPIGFQHLFNYLAYGLDTWVGDFSVDALKPVVDGMLKSPAARQMLVDHFEARLASGSITDFDPTKLLPQKHPYNITFYGSMNSLTTSGYPDNLRRVSLINGSGVGEIFDDKNGNDVTPGSHVLDAYIPNVATLTDAYMDAWYTPAASQQIKISEIWIDAPWLCFCDINAEEDVIAESYTDGPDAAPGGLFDLAALGGAFGGDPTIDAFFDSLTTDYFNFIPTVSAMGLTTNPNPVWYQNINLGAGDTPWDETLNTNSQTPFHNWYMPFDNEDHVSLTQNNVDFVINEIVRPYVRIAPIVFLQGAMTDTSTIMTDNLRANNVIPSTSPYIDAISTDPTIFNTTGNDAIVDWVYITLRDKNDNTNIINEGSALLQADGDIVGVDGVSPLKLFTGADDYFIAVKHRNHLGIMSLNPVSLDKNTTAINFTDGLLSTYGTNAQKYFSTTGLYALWSGDANGDESIKFSGSNNDSNQIRDIIINAPGNIFGSISYEYNGYFDTDTNLSASAKFSGSNNDSNLIRDIVINHPGNIFGSISYVISAQTP